jgi:hypothetical protein
MKEGEIIKKAIMYYLIKGKPPKVWSKIKQKLNSIKLDNISLHALNQIKYRKMLEKEELIIFVTDYDNLHIYIQNYNFKLAKIIIYVHDYATAINSNQYKHAYKILSNIKEMFNFKIDKDMRLSNLASILPYSLATKDKLVIDYLKENLKLVNLKIEEA